MTSTNDREGRPVKRLSELPQAIEPPEGLWLKIEAQITPRRQPFFRQAFFRRPFRQPYGAAAAVVLALLIGALGDHWLLPGPHLAAQGPVSVPAPSAVRPVSFIRDPRYLRQRAQLLAGLSARVAALPPSARQKVLASLATLQQSIRDLQDALGRDPSNALLQELLVDSCQDEMRVLVSVNEAGQDATQL